MPFHSVVRDIEAQNAYVMASAAKRYGIASQWNRIMCLPPSWIPRQDASSGEDPARVPPQMTLARLRVQHRTPGGKAPRSVRAPASAGGQVEATHSSFWKGFLPLPLLLHCLPTRERPQPQERMGGSAYSLILGQFVSLPEKHTKGATAWEAS